MESSSLQVRRYLPGDESNILDTFNLVFRQECGPAFRDRTLAEWQWLYAHNPAGCQIFLAVDDDGTVAAQYAAIPQTADTPVGALRFVHVVDSMTHPAYRAGLQRTGVFAKLGRAFTADYRDHGNENGYGFPVSPAERLRRRLLDSRLPRPRDHLLRSTP
ncbi:MAG: GNAT family N-acetyltransferase, partial [Planctomycetes bacterium]|nr:GNAT family N-acetyltransferase [Planctomycetota bacterium]